MTFVRVIPMLLLRGTGLVKTIQFKNPIYLGDPRNTLKIFSEKEVDELIVLDILATVSGRGPNFELLSELTSECFMPMGYGGGIKKLDQIEKVLKLGVEKVSINTYAVESPGFITEAANHFGSQSIVVSIDVKEGILGKYETYTHSGGKGTRRDPVQFAQQAEEAGAGEIILNSINRDGMMGGYDLELIKKVSSAVSIPVIASGGAGAIEDFTAAVKKAGAAAVAAGSIFVFHGKHRAVLISFPKHSELENIFI